ncbi:MULTISPECIES: CHAP domain-containing protein [Paenarthrobacter]|uniref:CHAP domain-containing protein n=1 Tax=Paenarthrobacter ureafaciens TaxID=37931 RepID=A0AAX3EPP4_PAEUR|nr:MULTISPECIES: CHAP domain-containing protein [Paenarthrobacter]NKR13744.1 amidase [Arthrobacter sp. M5]NKR18257.1 amidase [Arthrobacter sp. M6]MDO5866955.1 CHAP domain-containing protein [Paenarthrobacter sp. SD-2]MDO5878000.1 CHAP domain-containing protein [Paenarthrobacter sp. SD-1]UYV95363.1 CHAP domain-containing protein [Paenarthrobacter ureafaciens]
MQSQKSGPVLVAGAVLAPIGLVLSIILFGGGSEAAADVCSPGGASVSVDQGQLPKVAVAGYQGEQLKNAALVIDAGKALGLSARGQTIGVMTAMGESGLRVLDYGDGPGPDSRGLFQQRDNGAWGTYQDRMNPFVSATNFFTALEKVPGWEQLEPTMAAHRVQRNADPFHYQSYWAAAVDVVAALGDVKTTDLGGESSCGIPGQSGKDDDLPWRTSKIYEPSPLGMYNRECVDFALWRVNQQLGSTTAPYKVLNGTFRPDGAVLGSALTWKDGWDAKGWPTGTTPRVGAVVWYSPGTGGADGTYGHVAVVKAVNGDGSFLEEGYNGNPAPNDHTYYTRTVRNGTPSAFLYLPGSNQAEEP